MSMLGHLHDPLGEAKTYITHVVPWPDQPGQGVINLHWTYQKHDKRLWTGRAFAQPDEFIHELNRVIAGRDNRDIYLCLSQQLQFEDRKFKSGQHYKSAVRSRENAISLRSLFLDIDIGKTDKEGNPQGYQDRAAAVKALGDFIKATSFVLPTLVVNSGGGIHVYWCFDEALPRDEWQVLADALANAGLSSGLIFDSQCTVDAARILRVPNTFNYKQTQPRPVRLIGTVKPNYPVNHLRQLLQPYFGTRPVKYTNGFSAAEYMIDPSLFHVKQPVLSELSIGITDYKDEPVVLNMQLVSECAFIHDSVRDGGKHYANPLWNITTLLATFLTGSEPAKDGRYIAHLFANKHKDYLKEETDKLYDRKLVERTRLKLGWPHCQTIYNSGFKGCQTCPHFAEGKTPLHFAEPVVTLQSTPAEAIVLPPTTIQNPHEKVMVSGYTRNNDRYVCPTENDGQVGQPINTYMMDSPWLSKTGGVLALNFTTSGATSSEYGLQMHTVNVPSIVAVSDHDLGTHLAGSMMVLQPNEITKTRKFVVGWIRELQKTKDAVIASAPYGWNRINGKIEGFIYSSRCYMPGGLERPSAVGDERLRSRYTPTGSVDSWRYACKLLTDQRRPHLDIILASAFAGPLVTFTGHEGLVLSAYSLGSGIGKTSSMRTAQAVWGHPKTAMAALDDTNQSMFGRMGEIRHLPVYWDELRSEEDAKKITHILFGATTGRGRARLKPDATQREIGDWSTIMVIASNESLLGFVLSKTKMTPAGIYRIFEYEVAEPTTTLGRIDVSDAQRAFEDLSYNYGFAGEIYSKFLGNNFTLISKEIGEFSRALNQELSIREPERFWAAQIAVLLMGARYSNQLKLTDIDETSMKESLVNTLEKLRGEKNISGVDMKKADDVVAILARFLAEKRERNTLVTDNIHMGVGRPLVGSTSILSDITKQGTLEVHIGTQTAIMRIAQTALGKWLTDNGYSVKTFIRSMEDQLGAKPVTARLGIGTQFANISEKLLELPLVGSLSDLIR